MVNGTSLSLRVDIAVGSSDAMRTIGIGFGELRDISGNSPSSSLDIFMERGEVALQWRVVGLMYGRTKNGQDQGRLQE